MISLLKITFGSTKAQWKLVVVVAIGLLAGVTLICTGPIYYEFLRALTLHQTIDKYIDSDSVIIKSVTPGFHYIEHNHTNNIFLDYITYNLGDIVRNKPITGLRSPTMFLSKPGFEKEAGSSLLRGYFTYFDDLEVRIPELNEKKSLAGQFVDTDRINVFVSQDVANEFDIHIGDQFSVILPTSANKEYVEVRVVDFFSMPKEDTEFFKFQQKFIYSDISDSFQTIPFLILESDTIDFLGNNLPSMESHHGVAVEIDLTKITPDNFHQIKENLRINRLVLGSTLKQYDQTSNLDLALTDYEQQVLLKKTPILLVMFTIGVVILYCVGIFSVVLAQERQIDITRMFARGATYIQILKTPTIEAFLISFILVCFAPWLAAFLVSIFGYFAIGSGVYSTGLIFIWPSLDIFVLSLLGALISFATLELPLISILRTEFHSKLSGVPVLQHKNFFQRYHIDLILLIISVVILFQLLGEDSILVKGLVHNSLFQQLSFLLPVLMLLVSLIIILRGLPLLFNLLLFIVSKTSSTSIFLSMCEMARTSLLRTRIVTLLVILTSVAVFVGGFAQTINQSMMDQALYSSGADIRLENLRNTTLGAQHSPMGRQYRKIERRQVRPSRIFQESVRMQYEEIIDVDSFSLGLREKAFDLSTYYVRDFELLAVDTDIIKDIAWIRSDFANGSILDLIDSLSLDTIPNGIVLPENMQHLVVDIKPQRSRPNVFVSVLLRNSNGRYIGYNLGSLVNPDGLVSRVRIRRNDELWGEGGPPSLIALRIYSRNTDVLFDGGSILLNGIWTVNGEGEKLVVLDENNSDNIAVLKSSPDAGGDSIINDFESGGIIFSWGPGSSFVPRGISTTSFNTPVGVLASEEFLLENDKEIGDVFEISIKRQNVPVSIVGEVDFFPTMIGKKPKYLVSDLKHILYYANVSNIIADAQAEIEPNEVWISTGASAINKQQLLANLLNVVNYTPDRIIDRDKLVNQFAIDPFIYIGWDLNLKFIFIGVLFLVMVGLLTFAYVIFKNYLYQMAVLLALGCSVRQVASIFILQISVLSVIGVFIGTWIGYYMSKTIIPYFVFDNLGNHVVPTTMFSMDWSLVGILYCAILLVLIIINFVVFIGSRINIQSHLRIRG